ncbi:TPA: hypothetical protein I6209_002808 [Vibrio cholerae]|nr:hypothetical protein [Vibrio cholerae]
MLVTATIKRSTLFRLLCVFIILGFPRIYGTEVPMAIFIFPLFFHEIIQFFNRNIRALCFYFLICFSWFIYSLVVWFFSSSSILSDFLFFMVLFVKVQLALLYGVILYEVIRDKIYLLYIWSSVQICVIVASFLHKSFYLFMLGFISPRSADVFSEIFGLRTIGFGLFHIEGALIFLTSIFVILTLTRYNLMNRLYLLMSFVVSMTVARSAIIPFIMHSVFSKDLSSKIYLAFIFFVLISLSQIVDSGPLYEAFEVFRSIASDSSVNTRSTSAVIDMFILPSHAETYIYGDGRFYSDNGLFYMGTDIGYLRMLYFSGIIGVLFFIVVNTFFLILLFFKRDVNPGYGLRLMAFVFALVFFIMNAKGIFISLVFNTFIFRMIVEGVSCKVGRSCE